MPESTETKRKLLKSAKTLFWKHGIKRVTVEEISDQANVSKMTFYRYFKNKEVIAEAVLEQVFKQSMKRYDAIMESDDDFRIKVDAIVKSQYDDAKGISAEFVNDILKKDGSPLHKKLVKLNQASLNQVKEDFILAQKKGEIRKDLNIDFMMYMLNDMNVKVVDKELMKLYKSEEALIMELTNFFFYGILP